MISWTAEKPSNIALIKYMGKKDKEKNVPSNSSFSWTLDHLTSKVELEIQKGDSDTWEPGESDFPFEMSSLGREKFLNHLQRVKDHFGVKERFKVKSANNFPADCGIASSASSFAALTEAAFKACEDLSSKKFSIKEKAMMSARGSGSSCRSFWSGFVLWEEQSLGPQDFAINSLSHMVVIVGGGAKKVSSSLAHKKVESSLLFEGRAERTRQRLEKVLEGLSSGNWSNLYQVVWAEFWDMHALFETSEPSFSYFLPGTFEVLEKTRSFWEEKGDGPVVTMDAGPNVHLLWRSDQKSLALEFYDQNLKSHWTTLSNIEDIGFARV